MGIKYKTKISKAYCWECDCGANGYEPTYNEARSRAAMHKDCNHDPKFNKAVEKLRNELADDMEQADIDYPKL